MRLTASVLEKMPAMRGVADEVGLARILALRDAAGVGELDVFEVAGGGEGEELAETVGHLNVGSELDVLLMGEGGDVDGVLDDAELEVVADLHGRAGCRWPPAPHPWRHRCAGRGGRWGARRRASL